MQGRGSSCIVLHVSTSSSEVLVFEQQCSFFQGGRLKQRKVFRFKMAVQIFKVNNCTITMSTPFAPDGSIRMKTFTVTYRCKLLITGSSL